jgi:hypothetical protein
MLQTLNSPCAVLPACCVCSCVQDSIKPCRHSPDMADKNKTWPSLGVREVSLPLCWSRIRWYEHTSMCGAPMHTLHMRGGAAALCGLPSAVHRVTEQQQPTCMRCHTAGGCCWHHNRGWVLSQRPAHVTATAQSFTHCLHALCLLSVSLTTFYWMQLCINIIHTVNQQRASMTLPCVGWTPCSSAVAR